MPSPRERSSNSGFSDRRATIRMDLESSMKRAIKSGDLVELELLLGQTSAPSHAVVEWAVHRLAERPRLMKRKKVVKLLLLYGWGVNQKLGANEDPMLSTLVQDFKLVKWLLRKGANPGVISRSGDTPLSFAVAKSSVRIIKLLISANEQHNQDLGSGELVHRAVWRYEEEPDLEILDTLIRAGAPVDNIQWDQFPAYNTTAPLRRGTPLHFACKHGYSDVAEMLIANGADLHKQKREWRRDTGETPYEIAMGKNDAVMLEMMGRHVPRDASGHTTDASVYSSKHE